MQAYLACRFMWIMLHDLSVPDEHDVYPRNLVRRVLAPTEPQSDDPAILAGPNLLLFEGEVRIGCGPTLLDEAEALSVAIVATVERLSFELRERSPAPRIKT